MWGNRYGSFDLGKGKRVQVEFLSANPTGPLTVARGRGAVMGDTLARALEAAGYDVTREYYFNNAGRQMEMLGESLKIRYQQALGMDVTLSEDHYPGDYHLVSTSSGGNRNTGSNLASQSPTRQCAGYRVFS